MLKTAENFNKIRMKIFQKILTYFVIDGTISSWSTDHGTKGTEGTKDDDLTEAVQRI